MKTIEIKEIKAKKEVVWPSNISKPWVTERERLDREKLKL